jgi:SNF2 family DNA or RNA helicase
VAVITGATPKHERDEIFRRFQDKQDPLHVIVANPGTMSHGTTLTAATTIVWYAPTNSNDTYVQANARVRRPGQTRTTVIVHIAASKVERRIYDRLGKKGKMQGILLDLLEEQEVMSE